MATELKYGQLSNLIPELVEGLGSIDLDSDREIYTGFVNKIKKFATVITAIRLQTVNSDDPEELESLPNIDVIISLLQEIATIIINKLGEFRSLQLRGSNDRGKQKADDDAIALAELRLATKIATDAIKLKNRERERKQRERDDKFQESQLEYDNAVKRRGEERDQYDNDVIKRAQYMDRENADALQRRGERDRENADALQQRENERERYDADALQRSGERERYNSDLVQQRDDERKRYDADLVHQRDEKNRLAVAELDALGVKNSADIAAIQSANRQAIDDLQLANRQSVADLDAARQDIGIAHTTVNDARDALNEENRQAIDDLQSANRLAIEALEARNKLAVDDVDAKNDALVAQRLALAENLTALEDLDLKNRLALAELQAKSLSLEEQNLAVAALNLKNRQAVSDLEQQQALAAKDVSVENDLLSARRVAVAANLAEVEALEAKSRADIADIKTRQQQAAKDAETKDRADVAAIEERQLALEQRRLAVDANLDAVAALEERNRQAVEDLQVKNNSLDAQNLAVDANLVTVAALEAQNRHAVDELEKQQRLNLEVQRLAVEQLAKQTLDAQEATRLAVETQRLAREKVMSEAAETQRIAVDRAKQDAADRERLAFQALENERDLAASQLMLDQKSAMTLAKDSDQINDFINRGDVSLESDYNDVDIGLLEMRNNTEYTNIFKTLESVNELNEDLRARVERDQNLALQLYVSSISSDLVEKTKYPWTNGISLTKANIDAKTGSYNDNFIHDFQVFIKKIYLTVKLNTRNINTLRLSSIDVDPDSNSQLTLARSNLNTLLYTNIGNALIKTPYGELASTYSSDNNSMKSLIGANKYKELINEIIITGEATSTKRILTESLLKYIIRALAGIKEAVNFESNQDFYTWVIRIVAAVIINNSKTITLNTTISNNSGSSKVSKASLQSQHNSENNIYTFVKIRVDKVDGNMPINPRFKPSTDVSNQILSLGYYSSLNLKQTMAQNMPEIMPHNYLFGPYTKIYGPTQDNKTIAYSDSMRPLVDKLISGKSVTIIGYGASGSGKTSALIYSGFESTQDSKDGVLIHMCKQLSKKYMRLEVQFIELEGNINESKYNDAVSNLKIIPIPENQKNAMNESGGEKYSATDVEKGKYYTPRLFDWKDNGWYLDTAGVKKGDLPAPITLDKSQVVFNDTLSLGKYIIAIMEKKRTIAATTNNPVSSRSHMIILVRFIIDDPTITSPYLIICDFAGVENRFDCKSKTVRQKFETIKRCEMYGNDGECTNYVPFYEGIIESKIEKSVEAIRNLLSNDKTKAKFDIKTSYVLKEDPSNFSVLLKDYIPQKLASVFTVVARNKPVTQNSTDFISDINALGLNLLKLDSDISKGNKPTLMNNWIDNNQARILKDVAGIRGNLDTKIVSVQTAIKNSIPVVMKLEKYYTALEMLKKIPLEKDAIVANICEERVREGLFINNSLLSLRLFISHFIKNIQRTNKFINNPKFVNECAPIQSNPNFEDSFGNTTTIDTRINTESVIATIIRAKICCVDPTKIACSTSVSCGDFVDMTFAILNVINLSVTANNPPPIPHIDISDLYNELNRLRSISTFLTDSNLSDTSTLTKVNPEYIQAILTSELLNVKIKGSLQGDDNTVIRTLLSQFTDNKNKNNNIDQNILRLTNLITAIDRINSLTLIGTLEFTDTISKFGLNSTPCNYKYSDDMGVKDPSYAQFIRSTQSLYSTQISSN